jgi:hypothetical protein
MYPERMYCQSMISLSREEGKKLGESATVFRVSKPKKLELGIGQQKLTDIDIDMVYDFPILGTDISADTDMA